MLESQLIRTEKTQLSTLVHYRKFFLRKWIKTQFNSDFVIGKYQYNQQFFKTECVCKRFMNSETDKKRKREFPVFKSDRRTRNLQMDGL